MISVENLSKSFGSHILLESVSFRLNSRERLGLVGRNGHGKTTTTIKLINAQKEDQVLFDQNGQVEFKDVRQTVTVAVNLHGVVFPEPGEYRFQLLADNQLLGERKVFCRQVQMPPKDGNRPAQS